MSETKRIRYKIGHEKYSIKKDPFDGRITMIKTNTIEIPKSWDDVERIGKSRGGIVEKPEDLYHLVETPLLNSCIQLFKNGVRTTETTANPPNEGENIHIGLVFMYEDLNSKQQASLQALCKTNQDDGPLWKISDHHDKYIAASLDWSINRKKTSPVQVADYVDSHITGILKGQPTWATIKRKNL